MRSINPFIVENFQLALLLKVSVGFGRIKQQKENKTPFPLCFSVTLFKNDPPCVNSTT